MAAPRHYNQLPYPADSAAGRNNREFAEDIHQKARLYRPHGTNLETKVSTLSRFAARLIDRVTGKAYSADELLAMAGTPTAIPLPNTAARLNPASYAETPRIGLIVTQEDTPGVEFHLRNGVDVSVEGNWVGLVAVDEDGNIPVQGLKPRAVYAAELDTFIPQAGELVVLPDCSNCTCVGDGVNPAMLLPWSGTHIIEITQAWYNEGGTIQGDTIRSNADHLILLLMESVTLEGGGSFITLPYSDSGAASSTKSAYPPRTVHVANLSGGDTVPSIRFNGEFEFAYTAATLDDDHSNFSLVSVTDNYGGSSGYSITKYFTISVSNTTLSEDS